MLKNNIFINEVGLFRFGLAFSPAKQFFLKKQLSHVSSKNGTKNTYHGNVWLKLTKT